jgi:RNA polymerase sigma factor (sigma-70 family)
LATLSVRREQPMHYSCDLSEGDANCTASEEQSLNVGIMSQNPDAFDRMVRQYNPRIAAFVRSKFRRLSQADVEDVCSSTFRAVWVSASTLDPLRPLWPWLRTIATNETRDLMSRNSEQVSMASAPLPSTEGDTRVPAALTSDPTRDSSFSRWEHFGPALEAACRALSPEDKLILFAGTTGRDTHRWARTAAESIGSTPGTVRTRLARILAGLRAVLRNSLSEQQASLSETTGKVDHHEE